MNNEEPLNDNENLFDHAFDHADSQTHDHAQEHILGRSIDPSLRLHKRQDRTFVRAIAGPYNLDDELKRLRAQPRVMKAAELQFSKEGAQAFTRNYVQPKDGITQTFHLHLEEYAPGGKSQKHGHVNEAAFYILDGRGYEIHDNVRYDWEAGDIVVVHNNSVHQHANADPDKPARALVIKTKPMFMFMNMLFQKTVEGRTKTPAPGAVGYEPRMHEEDFNHPKGGY